MAIKNTIQVQGDNGQLVTLEAHDLLGSVTLNDEEIETLEGAKVALNLIIRSLAVLHDRGGH